MISPSELLAVIDDIKRVAAEAPAEYSPCSEDEDQTNDFLPRDYDIDRLHADDARDKVFVAILKALVARHNKPSSPKELATCIMRHEFTLLGGATPYATVSSRISQHFKRILEHIPPRPPILGRVAHEKHTRKYFYYVASALEQEEFLRKVRVGLIPTNTAPPSTGAARKSKTAKKTRCMVPAVAVEPDFSPAAAMRRSRRATSEDTGTSTHTTAAASTHMQTAGRLALQSGAGPRRQSSASRVQTDHSASAGSTRPRRTSYDGGCTRKTSLTDGNDTSSGESESESTNPYARKRYKSVKSAVAQTYSKRRSRGLLGCGSSSPVVSSMAPRARRSASHGDTQTSAAGLPMQGRSQSGAGKWRPGYTSEEDGSDTCEMEDRADYAAGASETSYVRSSRHRGTDDDEDDGDHDHNDGGDDDDGSGFGANGRGIVDDDSAMFVSESSSMQGRPTLGHRADSASSSSTATVGRQRKESSADMLLLMPPVPHTTPRASASPDRTPYPPATSPSLHSRQELGEDLAGSGNELQAASPLLLPRGLLSLHQTPLDSIFGSSPIAGKDIIPSPADMMMTPVVATVSSLMQAEDPVIPAAHPLSLLDTGLLQDAQGGCAAMAVEGGLVNSVKHNTTPENIGSPSGTAESHGDSVATTAAEDATTVEKPDSSAPSVASAALSTATTSVAKSAFTDDAKAEGRSEFDFSFHDLMDAELMSINELDKLWTNSNPSGSEDEYHLDMAGSGLETIPEVAAEDAASNGINAEHSELSSKLTQKLLALSSMSNGVAQTSKRMPTATVLAGQPLAKPNVKSSEDIEGVPPSLADRSRNNDNNQQQQQHEAPHAEKDKADSTSLAQQQPAATCRLPSANGSTGNAQIQERIQASQPLNGNALDSLEPTKVLVDNTDEHEETSTSCSKVILPDPFGDIPATAMVATKVPVSPRIVLTIVETVPVYMTVITTTESAGSCTGKWIVRRHRLLRLVENGYVNASSLLLAGGVASEQERSIVLSLEMGRFKWRRPQSKLYGTWIPLPRARALAATCSLHHRLGPFLNDNLEAYFPAPLPTTFIRHLIMPFFTDSAGALLAAADSEDAGLGIEFQHLVNSATGGGGHRPAQSIARSSTFGATARGAPSPSIIQSLGTRPGSFGFAGAAKAIFGTDDRHLQSLLQLLSTESPMLGTPGEADHSQSRSAASDTTDEAAAEPAVKAESPAKESTKPKAESSMANGAAKDSDGTPQTAAETTPSKVAASTDKETTVIAKSTAESEKQAAPSAEGNACASESSAGDANAAPQLPKIEVTDSVGVDAEKLAAAITSSIATGSGSVDEDPMECDDVDDEMEFDMSMVLPSVAGNDADMICRSTPPSPPPPPSLPLRQRRISNAPLTIPRTSSPALSIHSLDGVDGCDILQGDGSSSIDPHSRVQSRAQSPSGQQELQSEHQQLKHQHPVGSFNARLAQTMEAFGFTGAAKTGLLLRLRAAAAAKSTGRLQAVAPYMLYRNSGTSNAGSAVGGSGSASVKRGKASAAVLSGDDEEGSSGGGSRKRARVIRIPRVKPLPKSKANKNKSSAPDASVVMRLASAIYNHTLNMAALAQAQKQAAVATTATEGTATSVATSSSVRVSSPASTNAAASASASVSASPASASASATRVTPTSMASVTRTAPTTPVRVNTLNANGHPNVRPPIRPPQQQQKQQQHMGQRAAGLGGAVRPAQNTQRQQHQPQQRVASPAGGTVNAQGHPRPPYPTSPLQQRPGFSPNRPPIRRPVMRPGVMVNSGGGALSPGAHAGQQRMQQQQRPSPSTMVRRPPPSTQPSPTGSAVRSGQGTAVPRPMQSPLANGNARPLPRPMMHAAGGAAAAAAGGVPMRRPPLSAAGASPRPGGLPQRPAMMTNRPPMRPQRPPLNSTTGTPSAAPLVNGGGRPRANPVRPPPPLTQISQANGSSAAHVASIGAQQQQQQHHHHHHNTLQQPSPVSRPGTPSGGATTPGYTVPQSGTPLRTRQQQQQQQQQQLKMQSPIVSPSSHPPQLPRTPVSGNASSVKEGVATPSVKNEPSAS
ncbi:hypothetical protein GGI07_002256 [Coemansia sp. Benny D115]|nr:hypothetical protein GGI07_002256 [Coemansia sp. Benny D115]